MLFVVFLCFGCITVASVFSETEDKAEIRRTVRQRLSVYNVSSQRTWQNILRTFALHLFGVSEHESIQEPDKREVL